MALIKCPDCGNMVSEMLFPALVARNLLRQQTRAKLIVEL